MPLSKLGLFGLELLLFSECVYIPSGFILNLAAGGSERGFLGRMPTGPGIQCLAWNASWAQRIQGLGNWGPCP